MTATLSQVKLVTLHKHQHSQHNQRNKLRLSAMTSHFKDQPILVVPREFGVILVCGGQKFDHVMSAEQQLDLATRFIQIAQKRIRDGELEGHPQEAD